jgi:hypothetical protein
VPDDNPFKAREIEAFDGGRDLIAQWARLRDLTYERTFDALYGSGHSASEARSNIETRSTQRIA